MKVLLSTSPLHPYQSYNYKFPRFPILNLTSLASSLKDRHEIRIAANAAHRKKRNYFLDIAADFKPDVIGFALPSAVSAMTLEETIRSLKATVPGAKIACGGPFATFEYEFCLKRGADAVFLGEADDTFPAWIDGGAVAGPEADAPKGVALAPSRDGAREATQVIKQDLNTLPMPAWELLDYRPAIYLGEKAAAVEMSRGCPFNCSFCTVHEFGKSYRIKTADRMLKELTALWKMGFKELLFVDNSFGLDERQTHRLAEQMISRNLAFEFGTYIRADTICERPDMIRLLAVAGLRYVIVGFESYSDDSLRAVNKSLKHGKNIEAARRLRENGVFVIGSHIYGSPGEPVGGMFRTYFSGVRRSDLYKAGIYTPLPGSSLYAELRSKGLIDAGDPLAMDYMHYRVGDDSRRRRIQVVSIMLFLLYHLGPARLFRLFHKNRWTRRIFRTEYKALITRFLALPAGIFQKRATIHENLC